MTRTELAPAGVMRPEETVGFTAKGCEYVQWHSKIGALEIPAEHSLEILSPGFPFSPGSFLSSFLQHSLEILLLPPHRCPGMPLPSPSLAPSSDIPLPTWILALIHQQLSSLSAYPGAPFLPCTWVCYQPSKELVTPAPLMLEKTSLEYEAEDNMKQWEVLGSEEIFIAPVIDL